MSALDPVQRTSPEGMKKIASIIKMEMQYPRWVRFTAKQVLEDITLKQTHSRMKDFGYSEKIIKNTKVQNIQIKDDGELEYEIFSKLMRGKYDVAKGREEGTKRHKITPNKKEALSWIAGGFVRAFSKGHWVKGITKSNIIEKTIEEFEPQVQERLDALTEQFKQERMGEL